MLIQMLDTSSVANNNVLVNISISLWKFNKFQKIILKFYNYMASLYTLFITLMSQIA